MLGYYEIVINLLRNFNKLFMFFLLIFLVIYDIIYNIIGKGERRKEFIKKKKLRECAKMLKLKVAKKDLLGDEKVMEVVKDETLSKSKRFIMLFCGGLDVKEISVLMNVRYNFVYNVVSNYLRKEGLEDKKIMTKKVGVKDEILKLIEAGKTNVEISRELKANYNMVWKYRKEYEIEQSTK